MLEFMSDATDDPDHARWRHGLRQLQLDAAAGPEARAARRRRRVHRGQALPEDEQLHRRRVPTPGRHHGVLREDQSRQGRPEGPRLRDRGPGRSTDRRMGAGRGADPRPCLRRRRGGRHPHPQRQDRSRRGAGIHEGVAARLPGRDRADPVLLGADRPVPRRRRLGGHLGEPPAPSAVAAMQTTAATIAAEQNLLTVEERVVPVRRDLPPAGSPRTGRGRTAVPPGPERRHPCDRARGVTR